MSHHILHVFKHGCVLSKDRGFLVSRGNQSLNPAAGESSL